VRGLHVGDLAAVVSVAEERERQPPERARERVDAELDEAAAGDGREQEAEPTAVPDPDRDRGRPDRSAREQRPRLAMRDPTQVSPDAGDEPAEAALVTLLLELLHHLAHEPGPNRLRCAVLPGVEADGVDYRRRLRGHARPVRPRALRTSKAQLELEVVEQKRLAHPP
jgi:hypothetical protein